MATLIPAQTSDSRIFIAPNRASCGAAYTYHSCMRMEGVDKSFGDITSVYCPHPTRTGEFVEIAQIQGADGRWTTSLVGRLPLNYQSIIAQLANKKCAFDLQVHFGKCFDPTNFNTFDMSYVFENVRISSYSLGTLGALGPDERATIDETVAISAETAYQLFQVYPNATGANVTPNGPVPTMSYGNYVSCTDCLDSCGRFYGLQLPATTLASQDVYIVWTDDGGLTWNTTTLPCSSAQLTNPIASYVIQSDGTNLYITLNESGGTGHLYIVPISEVEDGTITSSIFSILDNTNTIYATFLYQTDFWTAGANGIVNLVDKASQSYTVIEDGTTFTNDWFAIHGIDSDNLIVGGEGGVLAVRRNGGSLQAVTFAVNSVTVTDDITSVWMKSEDEWLVGTEAGNLYCTTDSGSTWTLTQTFSGCVRDIDFPRNSTGYIVIKSPAQIWRTYDGGGTWVKVTDKYSQISSTSEFFGVSTCPDNPNTFVVNGQIPNVSVANPCDTSGTLFSTGSTGVLIVGRQ